MIDLNDNTSPYDAKDTSNIDNLLGKVGFSSTMKYIIKRALTSWVTYVVISAIIGGLGISKSDSDKIAGKIVAYDIIGGAKLIGKINIKSTIANSHPIYKTSFAADFKSDKKHELSSVVKFKVEDEFDDTNSFLWIREVLVSKEKFGPLEYNWTVSKNAYDVCHDTFTNDFFPVQSGTVRLNADGWEGKKKFECVFVIPKELGGK